MTQPLIVKGNVALAGTLTLSASSGGDIYVGKDWLFTAGGTFNSNNRAVFFNGSVQQSISRSSSGTLNFDYLLNNNSSGGIQLATGTNININGNINSSGINYNLVLAGTGTGNVLDLNGSTCTFTTVNSDIQVSGGIQYIKSSNGSGKLVIASPSTNSQSNVAAVSGGSLYIASSVLVNLNGGFDFGNALTTIDGTLQMNANSYVYNNAPVYTTNSLLQYNSGGLYKRTVEWGTASGNGEPYKVQLSNNTMLCTGCSGNTSVPLNTRSSLTIDAGSALYMDYGSPSVTTSMSVPLVVTGDIVNNGTLSASNVVGGDIQLTGNWINNGTFNSLSRTVYFNGSVMQTVSGTSNSFDYVVNNNSSGVIMGGDITIAQSLALSPGTWWSIAANSLNINGTINGSGTITGSTSSKITIGGSGTSSVGLLRFTSGSARLDQLTIDRVSAKLAVELAGSLSLTTLTLNNGIVATGNNLLETSFVNGNAAVVKPWAANTDSTSLKASFVALCDGNGNPVTATDGSSGFKVNNVSSSEVFMPVGYDYNSRPNRVSLINNNGNINNYTVSLFKGDIGRTPLSRVNRIWYLHEDNPGNSMLSVKLYFCKLNASQYGINQEEIETNFDWADVHLLHKSGERFINTSNGADVGSFLNNNYGSEVYGSYTYGISTDSTGITNGITSCSPFSVANQGTFILADDNVDIKALQQGGSALISWKVIDGKNLKAYYVEYSTDGKHFDSIGSVKAEKDISQYQWVHATPSEGTVFYRLRMVNNNGGTTYSKIALLHFKQNTSFFMMYPSPVKRGQVLSLKINNTSSADYMLTLVTIAGQQIYKQKISCYSSVYTQPVVLPSSIKAGCYFAVLTSGKSSQQKMIVIQ